MGFWAARTSLALFLLLAFAFSSPAQVTVGAGGTGTTSNTGASGELLVGQGDNTFKEKPMSGDCTLAATGAISCTSTGSSIILDLGDDGGNDSTALGEIAPVGDTNSIFTESAADKLKIDLTKNWPSADTADALDANGANCSAGSYPLGVDASGATETCTADDDQPDSDAEVPNGITVDIGSGGLVTGGTVSKCAEWSASGELGASSALCGAGSGGDVLGPGSSTDTAIVRWNGTGGTEVNNSGCTIDASGNLDCAGTVEASCTPASSDCGVITDDNSADHAAPGAGLVVWYSKSGTPYVRAGAAGSATQICTEADISGCAAAGAATECSTSSCNLNVATTLNSLGICLSDGTDCPAASAGDVTDVFSCASGDCASITMAATDLLDMSGVDASTATEGLILPQHATACAGGTAEGQVCWEADANVLHIGDSATIKDIYPGLHAASVSDGGPATTATALAANGGNCSAGNYPLGVDASGAVEDCTADDDVPESGDFGAASDLETTGALSADVVGTANIADGDHGDFSYASGVATLDADAVLLNEVGNPGASKTFTMANNSLTFNYTAPTAEGFSVEATGGFTGDLMHVHQHTGNPGAGTDLIHLEFVDTDVTGIRLTGPSTSAAGITIAGGIINTNSQIQSTLATGTAPFTVASVTEVANLRSATATALAANGANCSAGNYPLGVDASGAVETCTVDDDVPEIGDLAAIDTEAEMMTLNTDSGLDNWFGDNEASGDFDLDNSQKECIWLPAGAITCLGTAGCTAPAQVDGTNFSYLVSAFATDADDTGTFTFLLPDNIVATTSVSVEVWWISDNAACDDGADDDVCWVVATDTIAGGAAWKTGAISTTAVGRTDRCVASGQLERATGFSVTAGWLAGEMAVVNVSRDVDGGTSACSGTGDDDYAQAAQLIGVQICYGVDNIFSGEQ